MPFLATPGEEVVTSTGDEYDIASSILDWIAQRDMPRYLQILDEYADAGLAAAISDPEHSFWGRGEQETLVRGFFVHQTLPDIMQEYAPPGVYFGCHPADGARGFWKEETN